MAPALSGNRDCNTGILIRYYFLFSSYLMALTVLPKKILYVIKKVVNLVPQQILESLLDAIHEHAKDGDLKKHNAYYADDISLFVLKKK